MFSCLWVNPASILLVVGFFIAYLCQLEEQFDLGSNGSGFDSLSRYNFLTLKIAIMGIKKKSFRRGPTTKKKEENRIPNKVKNDKNHGRGKTSQIANHPR